MKPICRICHVAHWNHEDHVFKGEVPMPSELCRSASNNVVANPVANKKRGGDRHKDKEARKVYQRELMRKRRADAKRASSPTELRKQAG